MGGTAPRVRCGQVDDHRPDNPKGPGSMSTITLDDADRAIPLLAEDGYALIRDVLTTEEVERARAVCDDHLLADAEAENEIEATTLLRAPALNFMFDERVVAALRRWLGGTLAYYPNYVARLNRFTGWHVDHGFFPEFLPDASHVYDPGFRHFQCVVYLQDNEPGAGGGLDVRPGSHKWAIGDCAADQDEIARRYRDVVSIDSKAGDLIVFDGRLMHRGTPAGSPRELRKYGIFWSASRADTRQIDRYIEYFRHRVDYLRTRNLPPEELEREVRRHDLMRSVRFPDSYLPSAADVLREHGVTLAEMPAAAREVRT